MQGIVKVENNVFKTFIVTDNVEKRHSFANQPAVIRSDGSKYYYKEGKLHSFIIDGKIHPAVVNADGYKSYYKEGNRHSFIIDGKIHPAVVNADGSKSYYNEGTRHSFVVDGKPQPAIAYADGSKEYYKDGKKTTLDVLEQENNQSIDIANLSADNQKLVMKFIKFIEQ